MTAPKSLFIYLMIIVMPAALGAAPPVADQTLFEGILTGSTVSAVPIDQCHIFIVSTNGGNASHVGRFTGTARITLNFCDLTYVGESVLTAANGDSISGPFSAQLTPTATPGVFDNHETAFITGGT